MTSRAEVVEEWVPAGLAEGTFGTRTDPSSEPVPQPYKLSRHGVLCSPLAPGGGAADGPRAGEGEWSLLEPQKQRLALRVPSLPRAWPHPPHNRRAPAGPTPAPCTQPHVLARRNCPTTESSRRPIPAAGISPHHRTRVRANTYGAHSRFFTNNLESI